MNIGDIVEINGVRRMITRIDGDKFFSTPCGPMEKPILEEIVVEKPKRKRTTKK